MKKLSKLVLPMSFLTLFSCDSMDFPLMESQEDNVEHITINLGRMDNEDPDSRLMPTEDISAYLWQAKDTLGIFPSVGGQVEFPIADEDAGKTSASFSGGGWALKGGYYYSAYYPFNFYNRNGKAVPFSYLGQEQSGNDNMNHLRNYLLFASAPVQVKNGVLSFDMTHAGSILKLALTMPVAKKWSMVTVYTDADVLPVKKTINLQDASLSQQVVSYSDRISVNLKNISTTVANQEIVVWMAFPSVSEASHPLMVSVKDSEGFVYTGKVTYSGGNQAYASFTKHKWQRRFASPQPQEGMNSGISGWEESEEDYGGTLN